MDDMLTQEELNKIFSKVEPYKEERDSMEQFNGEENETNQVSDTEQDVNGNVENNSEDDFIDYEEYVEQVKKVLAENYGREVSNSILNEFMREIEKNNVSFESKEHVVDLFESYGYAKKYGFFKKAVGKVPVEILEPDDKAYSQSSQEKTKFDFNSRLKEILRAKYGNNVSEEVIDAFRKEVNEKGITFSSYDQVIHYFEKFGYADSSIHRNASENSKENTSSTGNEKNSNTEQKREEKSSQEEQKFEETFDKFWTIMEKGLKNFLNKMGFEQQKSNESGWTFANQNNGKEIDLGAIIKKVLEEKYGNGKVPDEIIQAFLEKIKEEQEKTVGNDTNSQSSEENVKPQNSEVASEETKDMEWINNVREVLKKSYGEDVPLETVKAFCEEMEKNGVMMFFDSDIIRYFEAYASNEKLFGEKTGLFDKLKNALFKEEDDLEEQKVENEKPKEEEYEVETLSLKQPTLIQLFLQQYYGEEISDEEISQFISYLKEQEVTGDIAFESVIVYFEKFKKVPEKTNRENSMDVDISETMDEIIKLNDVMAILYEWYNEAISQELVAEFIEEYRDKLIGLDYADDEVSTDIITYFENFKEKKEKKVRKVKEVKPPKEKKRLGKRIKSFFSKNIIQDDEFEFEFEDNPVDDFNWVRETIQKFLNYNNIVLSEDDFQIFLEGISLTMSNGGIGTTEEELINYLLSMDSSYVYGDSPEFDSSGRSM